MLPSLADLTVCAPGDTDFDHVRGCMTTAPNDATVTSDSTEITWDAASRIALVRYTSGVTLTGPDGPFLVDA